ncbi:peroxiredoxin-like family protein [Mesorhizobium sp. LHD-90]|uniref:peroxiredoxin-like family protein n=1 Tax=Mesorhizobium sp. LHD-90 TaxID=3071414 RepID=UPI0027DF7BF8|nr:peroxiredoxin-like family protein [Mesorhizobium sp. LHD-90]MDQ6433897.1 peroxiredoxin-like family protein [Mesorhizobium sp. LHD-90]
MTEQISLNQTLADFQAKRALAMPADKLKISVDQRRTLVETADRNGFVKAGDVVAPFEVEEVGGETLSLGALVKDGPAVLIFFRFAGCPACNVALPYYDKHLAPDLARLGAVLVGVSPQVPEKLVEIKQRHDLSFLVATDRDNRLGRRFGILYSFDEASRRSSLESGTPIGEVTGTGTWELPMPAVVVIDRSGTVRFADVSPDWLVRTEPLDIIAAVRDIMRAAAA